MFIYLFTYLSQCWDPPRALYMLGKHSTTNLHPQPTWRCLEGVNCMRLKFWGKSWLKLCLQSLAYTCYKLCQWSRISGWGGKWSLGQNPSTIQTSTERIGTDWHQRSGESFWGRHRKWQLQLEEKGWLRWVQQQPTGFGPVEHLVIFVKAVSGKEVNSKVIFCISLQGRRRCGFALFCIKRGEKWAGVWLSGRACA